MKIKTIVANGLLLLSGINSFAQSPQPLELAAKRVNKPVKIDGLINEEAWKDAAVMTNLVEFRPTVGKKEEHENRTITYLMYNDEGIYFGG
jgi:hypothetical protein